MIKATILPLTKEKLNEAIEVVFAADLDTREEIKHHLEDTAAHYIALNEKQQVVGVIGWYQDTVNYANEAMGDKFPGEEAYWVGFFAVDKKYRGQGIGYALISKLEEVLRAKNITELWVCSVPETAEYYRRQGFQEFMKAKIAGEPKVFMVKYWQ